MRAAIVVAVVASLAAGQLLLSDLASAAGAEGPQEAEGEKVRLDLRKALELADATHPTIKAALASLEEARASFERAWASLLPVVTGTLVFTHNDKADKVRFGTQTIIARRQDDLSGSIRVDLPLIEPRLWLGIKQASIGEDIAALGAEQVRQALLLSVAQTFYQALTAKALVEIDRAQIERNQRHLESALARVQTGTGSALDVFRAKTELVTSRELLVDAENGLRNTLDALRVLVGLSNPVEPVASVPAGTERLHDGVAEQLEQRALKKREDLRIARQNERLARWNLGSSWMNFVPSLVGSWQFSYQFTDPSAFRATDKSRWYYFLTLSVPIYDHTRYADLDAKRAALTRTRAELEDATRKALLEVRTARREYEKAMRQVAIAAEKADLAEKTAELAQAAYENGTGTALEVIDAQRAHLQAQIDLAVKRLSVQVALLSLLRAAGADMKRLDEYLKNN